ASLAAGLYISSLPYALPISAGKRHGLPVVVARHGDVVGHADPQLAQPVRAAARELIRREHDRVGAARIQIAVGREQVDRVAAPPDRKSTRLNSSHVKISYAV